jgi:hypothetical protein
MRGNFPDNAIDGDKISGRELKCTSAFWHSNDGT